MHPNLHYICQRKNHKRPALIMSSQAVQGESLHGDVGRHPDQEACAVLHSKGEDDDKVGDSLRSDLSHLLLNLDSMIHSQAFSVTRWLQFARKMGRSGFSTIMLNLLSTTKRSFRTENPSGCSWLSTVAQLSAVQTIQLPQHCTKALEVGFSTSLSGVEFKMPQMSSLVFFSWCELNFYFHVKVSNESSFPQ